MQTDDELTRRARLRRFGIALVAIVAIMVLATFGYVKLFDQVLRDPNAPPSVTSDTTPRVRLFEICLAAAIAMIVATALFVRMIRRRRESP